MAKAQKGAKAKAEAEKQPQKEAKAKAEASKGDKIEVVLHCWYGNKKPLSKATLPKDVADGLISRGNAIKAK